MSFQKLHEENRAGRVRRRKKCVRTDAREIIALGLKLSNSKANTLNTMSKACIDNGFKPHAPA